MYTGRAKQSYYLVFWPKYKDEEKNDDEHDDNTIIITIFNNEEFVIFFKTCVCMYAGTARDSRANLVANRSKANNSRKTILLMMMMEK